MARPFLFGGVNPNASTSKYLVEFKAGKMKMEGNMVHPIDRKGVLYINQSSDDNLVHFCWKDRTTGTLEDDLIIFPDEAEFKRVNSCKTGRVYMLKFKNSTRKNFYWMQEPREDKDEELCSKVNEYLNNPPPPGSRRGGSGGESSSSRDAGGAAGLLGQLADISDADLQNLLNNMSPQQLVQMLSGVSGAVGVPPNSLAGLLGAPSSGGSPSRQRNSGATTTATSNTSTTSSGQSGTKTSSTVSGSSAAPAPIQLSDLQSIISGLTVPPDALTAVAGAGAAAPSSATDIDLSTSLSFESLKPLLSNEEFMSRVKEFLPPTLDPSGAEFPVPPSEVPEHLASTVSSPQFQSALAIFSTAFQSGQLGPLISQFNLGGECVEAANQGNLISFVKALDKRNGGNVPATENNNKKEEGEDDMALD